MDLVALRRPVEHQFPNEKWFRIEPFRGPGKVLLEAYKQDPGNAELLLELLRLAVPTATEEDFNSLSLDEDVPRVLAAADGKAALMEAFLKNAISDGGLSTPSPTLPSSPTTTSSTSSDTSPEDTASLGPPSSTPTGTTPSSPSPPSKKSKGSSGSRPTGATSATSAST